MKEIKILDYFPIILSKDYDALKLLGKTPVKEGALVRLPKDAILVKPRKVKK